MVYLPGRIVERVPEWQLNITSLGVNLDREGGRRLPQVPQQHFPGVAEFGAGTAICNAPPGGCPLTTPKAGKRPAT